METFDQNEGMPAMYCSCEDAHWNAEQDAKDLEELMRQWEQAKARQDFEAFDLFLLAWRPSEHRFARYGREGFSAGVVQ